MRINEWLHDLNVRYPWLKVVALLFLLLGTAVGVEELLRRNISRPTTPPSTAVALLTKMPTPGAILAEDTEAESQKPSEVAAPTETTPTQEPQPEKTTEEVPKENPKGNSGPEAKPATPPTSQVATPPTSNTRKLVALTFDDGPSRTETVRLLRILADRNVKATFFVVGNNAQRAPEILQQAKAAGHEVGSHTMTHANLNRSSVESIRWEVAAMDQLFLNILGEKSQMTRPPYGNMNATVRANVAQPLILWTVDPEDWKVRNTATVRQRAVAGAFDGAIILFHDIYATTVDAIPGVIDDLRARGYEFMTVSEMAAARGVRLQNGVGYGSFRP